MPRPRWERKPPRRGRLVGSWVEQSKGQPHQDASAVWNISAPATSAKAADRAARITLRLGARVARAVVRAGGVRMSPAGPSGAGSGDDGRRMILSSRTPRQHPGVAGADHVDARAPALRAAPAQLDQRHVGRGQRQSGLVLLISWVFNFAWPSKCSTDFSVSISARSNATTP